MDQLSYFAAATYGADTYGCGAYNASTSCTTTSSSDAPLGPLTGFFTQPLSIILPVLIGLAIVLGVVTYTLSRFVKHRKNR